MFNCLILIWKKNIESAPVQPPPVKEEPEKIRKWREEQKARLEEKGICWK